MLLVLYIVLLLVLAVVSNSSTAAGCRDGSGMGMLGEGLVE